jgi:glycerol uptake facilitator protein
MEGRFLRGVPSWTSQNLSTIPTIRDFGASLFGEIIGTFVLVFVVGAIFSKAAAGTGLVAGLGGYLVAALIWAIGLSVGGTTGYAINPARDLGPRIAHALPPIAGKASSGWGYAIVPVLGPLIGAGLAGIFPRAIGLSTAI